MIRYLYADQLNKLPQLRDSMFHDRAAQFHDRLGWAVRIDENGYETDIYDDLNPLYVIWQHQDGRHGGSMRFLPTTGPVMVNDHFRDLTHGVAIESPLIWEVTRFCLAPDLRQSQGIAAALMLAGAELGQGFYLDHAVGVFDARMVRIYKSLGWPPEIIGTRGQGAEAISVGLWDFNAAPFDRLCKGAGISRAVSQNWFRHAFDTTPLGPV